MAVSNWAFKDFSSSLKLPINVAKLVALVVVYCCLHLFAEVVLLLFDVTLPSAKIFLLLSVYLIRYSENVRFLL